MTLKILTVDFGTLPRSVMFLLAFSLATLILCCSAICIFFIMFDFTKFYVINPPGIYVGFCTIIYYLLHTNLLHN